PPHDFWVTDPANHAMRWTQVTLLALALLGMEQLWHGAWRTSAPVRFIEVFGMSSLAGYFFHAMLLFFRIFGLSFDRFWRARCTWPQYWMLLVPLIAMTFALTWLTDKLYGAADSAMRRASAPISGPVTSPTSR